MCMLIPSMRPNTFRCKRCTKAIQSSPCMHCGFVPEAPSKNLNDNHNVKQVIHDKHN